MYHRTMNDFLKINFRSNHIIIFASIDSEETLSLLIMIYSNSIYSSSEKNYSRQNLTIMLSHHITT